MARIRPIPMGRFRARVLDLYRDLGRRPLTLCKLRQVLAELAALEDANGHLTIVKSTDLTTGNLAHWDAQNRTRRAPATRAGLMSYARAACSYAVEEAWLPRCQSAWLFPGLRRETPWRGGRLGHRPIDALRAAAQAAGVACPGWHALRHSWITHARTRWGIPDAIVALIAGHTSIAMTDIYTHPDAANLAAATERITYR